MLGIISTIPAIASILRRKGLSNIGTTSESPTLTAVTWHIAKPDGHVPNTMFYMSANKADTITLINCKSRV